MTICSLDTFMYGLRMAIMAADEAVRARRESVLRGDIGRHLQVHIPESPAVDAPLVPMVIPLHLFRDPGNPRMAFLSVEFDVRFRQRRIRGERRPVLLLDMRKPRLRWFGRGAMQRLRISYRLTDHWEPRVELDGRVLSLPPMAGQKA